ncbi:PqqD family peptide modification chaperone [Streptomyces sp. NPDC092296]|uniref:PqqD family peptide modification chaperone n=1 Tax=Streptomyces sp. NPDC092296 TaxID=3366012 RepID=UPI00381BF226
MLTLAPGTRILVDGITGRGTLITAAGGLWTLSSSGVTALTALRDEGTAAAAEAALRARYPAIPREQVRADLDALVGKLMDSGVVVDR